jgi:hypothetical protein
MSHSNNFHIGYGNYSTVYSDGNKLTIDLYYGELSFDSDLVNDLIDDCGISWSLSDFVKYCGN